MKTLRETFRVAEKKLRDFRDRRIIEPFVRSRSFQKHMKTNDDASILNFGDHCLAFDPNDMIAGWLRDKRGWFRKETMRVFDALPRRGGTFVDVGANIGTQTVYALKFGGFDRAVCFEPDPHNARYLWLNAAINGFADRIVIVEAAAGTEAGQAELSLSHRSGGTNSMAEKRGDNSILVPVVSIEEELRKIGVPNDDVGLAWIDVEGYEGQVLKGWPSLPGTPLCIEYTPEPHQLPPDTFTRWERWADVRQDSIDWQPISRLDLASYTSQVDLLFS